MDFVMNNPIKMDDLGVPTPPNILGNPHIPKTTLYHQIETLPMWKLQVWEEKLASTINYKYHIPLSNHYLNHYQTYYQMHSTGQIVIGKKW